MRESMAIDWRVDLTNESCMINDIALQDHEEAWRRKPITGCLLTWHLFWNTVVWKPLRSLLLQNVWGAHKRWNLLKLINNYKQMVKRSVLTVLPDISREPCSFKPYKTMIWIRGRLWMIYSCNLIFSLWLILYRIVVFIVYVMSTPQQWILSFCNKLQWSW